MASPLKTFNSLGTFTVDKNPNRKSRWFFGGLSSAGAACCTHPLDLIKVHLQTATAVTTGGQQNLNIINQTVKIVRGDGILALYNGLSASLLRQLTYSTVSFAIYDVSTYIFDNIPLIVEILTHKSYSLLLKIVHVYIHSHSHYLNSSFGCAIPGFFLMYLWFGDMLEN